MGRTRAHRNEGASPTPPLVMCCMHVTRHPSPYDASLRPQARVMLRVLMPAAALDAAYRVRAAAAAASALPVIFPLYPQFHTPNLCLTPCPLHYNRNILLSRVCCRCCMRCSARQRQQPIGE